MLKAMAGHLPPARWGARALTALSVRSTSGEGQGSTCRLETFICGFAATGRVSAQGRVSAGAGLGALEGLATTPPSAPPPLPRPPRCIDSFHVGDACSLGVAGSVSTRGQPQR